MSPVRVVISTLLAGLVIIAAFLVGTSYMIPHSDPAIEAGGEEKPAP